MSNETITKTKSGMAKVTVKNNRYYFDGEFHKAIPNTPIRRDDGKLCGVTNPREMTYVHTYGSESPYWESVPKGKLLGTRCDNPDCEYKGTVYVPFRIHCPDCFGKNTIIDLTQIAKDTATVYSFMVTERTGAYNTLKKPIKFINIEFEGVDTILMGYMSLGEPKFGMRVVPIFKTKDPTYTITDLSWVPEGTKESELPEGFTF